MSAPGIQAIGLTELQQQFSTEAPKRMRVLSSQTLNRGATRGRTRLVRIVGAELNLPATYIRDQVRTRNATPDKLESRIIANKRPIRLAEFDAKPYTRAQPRQRGQKLAKGAKRPRVAAGITVRVKRGGPRQVLPGTFLFRAKNGALLAAVRAPAAGVNGKARSGKNVITLRPGRTRRKQRLAVQAFYGPSVDQSYQRVRPQIAEDSIEFVRAELDRRIARETLGNQARGLVR